MVKEPLSDAASIPATTVRSAVEQLAEGPLLGPVRSGAERLGIFCPPTVGSFYLETRLDRPEHRPDFLYTVPVGGAQGLLEAFARQASTSSVANERWQCGIQLVQHWRDRVLRSGDLADSIYLEYDDPLGTLSCPAMGYCIVPHYFRRELGQLGSEPVDSVWATTSWVFSTAARVASAEFDPSYAQRCVETLNRHGRIIYVTPYLGRSPIELKFYVCFLREHLGSALDLLGWRGLRSRLAWVLETYFPPDEVGDRIYLDIDLGRTLDPSTARIGVAFGHQYQQDSVQSGQRLERLLEKLIEHGFCSHDVAQQLRSWPSMNVELGGTASNQSSLLRWLDVKFVIDARSDVQAKAYLGFCDPRVNANRIRSGSRETHQNSGLEPW